jgi:hypothetical protein
LYVRRHIKIGKKSEKNFSINKVKRHKKIDNGEQKATKRQNKVKQEQKAHLRTRMKPGA